MDELKRVGHFLYQYQDDDTVVVAKISILSNLAGQSQVHEKMDGITEHTGSFRVVEYNNTLYTGVIFKAIPEDKLISTLEEAD